MSDRRAKRSKPEWLDGTESGGAVADVAEGTNGASMWVGEHAVDGDILIFDPDATATAGDRVSFYSTTQLRTRVFPRSIVAQKIREVTDDVRVKRAKKDYDRRAELRETHEAGLATARVTRQHDQIIERHERYLAKHNIGYQGVQPTPADHRPSKRIKCHACGLPLDDMAHSLCGVCAESLCSCGACACGRARRKSQT